MSFIAGHAAAGIAAYLCCNSFRETQARWAVIPYVGLAVGPDLDYLAVWWLGYTANPRVSHSLLVALAAALVVKRLTRPCITAGFHLGWLLAASMSHALLDFLVGAHPVPLFWPLNAGSAMPIGVLPSAGALAIGNVYLWRNLLIELGVLVPALAGLIAVARKRPLRQVAGWGLPIAPVWILFLIWSIALQR